jgi:hypothetical protein
MGFLNENSKRTGGPLEPPIRVEGLAPASRVALPHRRGRATVAAVVRPEPAIAEAVPKAAGSSGSITVRTTAAVSAVTASANATITEGQRKSTQALAGSAREGSDMRFLRLRGVHEVS